MEQSRFIERDFQRLCATRVALGSLRGSLATHGAVIARANSSQETLSIASEHVDRGTCEDKFSCSVPVTRERLRNGIYLIYTWYITGI